MRVLIGLLVTMVAVGAAATVSAARPNVLLICVDDLKPALGCYGDSAAVSPNIDRLVERGMRFERAYCNQAVCAPSRNALLTGLRPQTLGIYDLGTNFRVAAPDAVTLPQYFKSHGYRSEGFGKIFHRGHGNQEDDASWSVPHWGTNVVSYALQESRAPRGLTREEALFSNVPGERARRLPRGAAYENADVADDTYPAGQLAAEAIRRLEAAAEDREEPFFLAVGFVKPHLPFCAPKKYWDLYDRDSLPRAEVTSPPEGAPRFAPTDWGELRQYSGIPEKGELPEELRRTLIHGYYAAMSYADAQIGRVLDALERTGLAENTIVVLWGDHGWHLGDHGMWCKHTNYEQAARIPLIVVVPGAKPGVSSALVESVDLYPTLCELAGLDPPTGLDGTSFARVVRDPAKESLPAAFQSAIHVYPRGEKIGRAVRTERYRLVEWKRPREDGAEAILELYDYERDPLETKNLAAERAEEVAVLRAILDAEPAPKEQVRK